MKTEDVKKIISEAIDREVEAYAFYRSVADRSNDKALKTIFGELEAMQLYTQLAGASVDTEQQFLFSQLANMEKTHKARLEDIYTDMAFPEAW